jgi:large subunit ribosomal protein L6
VQICLEWQETDRDPKGGHRQGDDGAVEVQGPKGKMRQAFPSGINFEMADGHLTATPVGRTRSSESSMALARSLVANAVVGVTDGYKRELDIVGVGYRAEVKGKQVVFALGYSHSVVFDIPTGIDITIDKQTHITVTGVDRQLVGEVVGEHSSTAKPDPYKQKGRPLHRRSAEEESGQDGSEVGSGLGLRLKA